MGIGGGVSFAGEYENPKDQAAKGKVRMDLFPGAAQVLVCLALQDGAEKYGAFNWRTNPIRASAYLAAAERHLKAFQDGEELAADSGIHHIAHAIAGLAIMLDAKLCGRLIDDRPPPGPTAHLLSEQERK